MICVREMLSLCRWDLSQIPELLQRVFPWCARVSFEVCDEDCRYQKNVCLSISKEEDVSYCPYARVREMLEEWNCDRCGRNLGLSDTRHIICEPPYEEINRAKEELAKGNEYVPVKAYAVLSNVCDFCLTEADKLLERFFFNL